MWLKGGDIVNKSFDDFLKSLDFEALAKKHATTFKNDYITYSDNDMEALVYALTKASTALLMEILRMYHEWLHE